MDVLAILCTTVAALIIYDAHKRDSERSLAIASTRDSVRAIQGQLDMRVVGERGAIGEKTYPPAIDADWFEGSRPVNALVSANRPWMETAAIEELSLRHPHDITINGGAGAMFWYNPVHGVVRARVPRTLTDRDAIALYNMVNGTAYGGASPMAQVGDSED